jgi:hypothetical protein
MSNTYAVKPAPGRIVPDPEYGDDLPAEGRDVPKTPYWVRRLKDGDVIEAQTKKPVGKPAKTEGAA